MLSKLDGVAFLGLHGSKPRTVDINRSGIPCEGEHVCLTGPVRRISYASSRAIGAAVIHRVSPRESATELSERLKGERLQYQPIRGELAIVSVPVPVRVADANGRGQPPWDRMAELDEEVAIELKPQLQGIRELCLRPGALSLIELHDAVDFEPEYHVEEILAAARRIGG